MEKQNYTNHIRYYPPHHFVFLPLMGGLILLGMWKGYYQVSHRIEWLLFSIISACILYLAVMLRQHYALGNQDRIVRLEFRLRYFEIFGKRSQEAERNLSFKHIAALRFAGDQEFPILLDRALKDKLSADEIKKAIRQWQPDYMRL